MEQWPEFLRSLLTRKFSRDVVWNLFSLGVLGISGVVLNVIILKFRGPEALGSFNQVYAIYIILAQIGVGGLQFSVLKHISHHQNDLKTCSEITSTAFILISILASVVGCLSYAATNYIGNVLNSPMVKQGLYFILPGVLFFSLNKALLMVLNGLRAMRAYAIFRAGRYFLLPFFLLLVIILRLPSSTLSAALTVTEMFLFLSLLIYIRIRLFPLFEFSSRYRDWYSRHIAFGVRGVLSGVLTELDTRVDILMLGYFSDDTTVGLYSFAAILAEGFAQIPLIVRQNVDPVLGSYFADGQNEAIINLAHKIRRVFYPIMFIISLLAVLIYPILFRLLSNTSNFTQSWLIFTIIMLGVALNAGYRPFLGIMLQGGRPGTYTLFVLLLVIGNVILNAVFIPWLGVYGAAVVNVLLYSSEAVLLVLFAKKLFGVRL